MAYTRAKKLTDPTYAPTNPASESDIRSQVDGAIQEVYDMMDQTGANNSGAHYLKVAPIPGVLEGIAGTLYAMLVDLKNSISDVVLGQIPDGTITNAKLVTPVVIVDNLIETVAGKALDAVQGKALSNLVSNHSALTVLGGAHKIAVLNPITYYVSPTGNDTTGNGTSGNPFATIQHALDILPKILLANVTINVAQGTYPEIVDIKGFIGTGSIYINGGADSTAALNYIVNGIWVDYGTTVPNVYVTGFKAIRIDSSRFAATQCSTFVRFINCVSNTSLGYAGFINSNSESVMQVLNCIISNCTSASYGAIECDGAPMVLTRGNTGTNNAVALFAADGGLIAKDGTQPSGTTAELTASGGNIR